LKKYKKFKLKKQKIKKSKLKFFFNKIKFVHIISIKIFLIFFRLNKENEEWMGWLKAACIISYLYDVAGRS